METSNKIFVAIADLPSPTVTMLVALIQTLSALLCALIAISYFVAWWKVRPHPRILLALGMLFLFLKVTFIIGTITTWTFFFDNSRLVIIPYYEWRGLAMFFALLFVFASLWLVPKGERTRLESSVDVITKPKQENE